VQQQWRLLCLLQVNEAVNDLLIDEEDFDGLKSSIASFDNFDQVRSRWGCGAHYKTTQYNTLWRNLPWEPQGSTSLRATSAHTLFSCIIPFISVGRLRSPSVNSGTR
jgi:hypothetical protein